MGFSRVKVYEDDKTWAWKFFLRILAILLDLTGIALTAWALSTSVTAEQHDYGSYYYGDQIVYIPWNLITFSLSFIWCLTNICILLSRSCPVHPGANVGCDLFLWLSFIATGFFSTIGAVSALDVWDESDDSYYSGLDSGGGVVAAASALALLMILIHFALFISACRYTHQHRRQRYAVTNEKITKEATVIAREIIAQMAQEGRIPPAAQQHPLLAVSDGGGGHMNGPSVASPSSSPSTIVQQPVPQVMMYGANPGPVMKDGIEAVPRGTAMMYGANPGPVVKDGIEAVPRGTAI